MSKYTIGVDMATGKDKSVVWTPQDTEAELIEKLAAIEHQRWADWQKWCHKVLRENNPSSEQGDILERWDRQIEASYAELSEEEKQSDHDQVMRYWPLIVAHDQEVSDAARIDELNLLDNKTWLTAADVQAIIDNRLAALQAKKGKSNE